MIDTPSMIERPSDALALRLGNRRIFEAVARQRRAQSYAPRLAAYRARYPLDHLRVLTPEMLERRAEAAFRDPEHFMWLDGIPVPVLAGGAANTNPIFPLAPNMGFATMTAANVATDGTGTVNLLITAGANASRVDRILLLPLGTNVASKAYLFLNNGGAQGTATNNALVRDIPLPITTASNTLLIGSPIEIILAMPLKSTWTLNATIATGVAAGWKVTAVAGDY
jgi:hypothetical protein